LKFIMVIFSIKEKKKKKGKERKKSMHLNETGN
jgi:hypothetical protein